MSLELSPEAVLTNLRRQLKELLSNRSRIDFLRTKQIELSPCDFFGGPCVNEAVIVGNELLAFGQIEQTLDADINNLQRQIILVNDELQFRLTEIANNLTQIIQPLTALPSETQAVIFQSQEFLPVESGNPLVIPALILGLALIL